MFFRFTQKNLIQAGWGNREVKSQRNIGENEVVVVRKNRCEKRGPGATKCFMDDASELMDGQGQLKVTAFILD
jgi:hypothetical protein